MKTPPHLSWANFRSSILVAGEQRVHRVSADPVVEIFGDGVRGRVGLWLEVPEDSGIPEEVGRLAFVSGELVERDGLRLLELVAVASALHRQFYLFAIAVAGRVVEDGCAPAEAVVSELECFGELLEQKPLLGTERQIGLFGELIVLGRLVRKAGPGSVDDWIGPLGEPHDFRVGDLELEVKTTLRPERVHVINGTEQVVPSDGCSLLFVSVLLGPGGETGGSSLADEVDSLAGLLSPRPDCLGRFWLALETCGFREADKEHYGRRFALRRPLAAIPVGPGFPAITRPLVESALGPLAGRVESLRYEANLEGLGHEDGTAEFGRLAPF